MNSVPPTLFASSQAAYGASGQRWPAYKTDEDALRPPSSNRKTDRERERGRERDGSTLTAYSPLRTSPARKDKCSRLAIYLNSRSRRGNDRVRLLLFPPIFSSSWTKKGEEVEGGGNFTKEDDYRGTRGERGDAVKRRFCHSLVQPSISGACLSRVCVCVCVCVCRVSKFLGKSIPIRVFLFEIGEK